MEGFDEFCSELPLPGDPGDDGLPRESEEEWRPSSGGTEAEEEEPRMSSRTSSRASSSVVWTGRSEGSSPWRGGRGGDRGRRGDRGRARGRGRGRVRLRGRGGGGGGDRVRVGAGGGVRGGRRGVRQPDPADLSRCRAHGAPVRQGGPDRERGRGRGVRRRDGAHRRPPHPARGQLLTRNAPALIRGGAGSRGSCAEPGDPSVHQAMPSSCSGRRRASRTRRHAAAQSPRTP